MEQQQSERKIYDLHCHSDKSDGILSPAALVSRAKQKDVSVLALTDHDTIAGWALASEAAANEGIALIAGVEFSTQWRQRNVHIVGLAFDPDSAAIRSVLAKQSERRNERAQQIGDKLERVLGPGLRAVAEREAAGGAIGRPHFARAMVELGLVASVEQAFGKYLGNGKIGDIKQFWPDMHECIDAIREAGGIAVLAHPCKYKLTRTKLCDLLGDFCEAGGGALEVVSGRQPAGEVEDMARLALRFELRASCGSDFHMPGQPWNELGTMTAMPSGVEPVWRFWQ